MFEKRVLVVFLSCLLVFLVGLLIMESSEKSNMLTRMIVIDDNKASKNYVENDMKVVEVNTNSEQKKEETNTSNNVASTNLAEQLESKAVVAQPAVVYDGMTMDELASKLERSMKNELSGKGYLYASYSLAKGVDPYLALAISLEETGCNYNCSNLVKSCNNVGGMKGFGCGSYGYFNTLDDGIRAFIDNIYKNYVAYGLTTADTMNSKYAENPAWSVNVNNYIKRIKNN